MRRRRSPRIGRSPASACCSRRERRPGASPQPLYIGASRDVFAVAGDNAGNAFAVLAGESLDQPLLLIERSGSGRGRRSSGAARGRSPAGSGYFTTRRLGTRQVRGGRRRRRPGLIVWRAVPGAAATLRKAMVREPPLRFVDPGDGRRRRLLAARRHPAAINPRRRDHRVHAAAARRPAGAPAFVVAASPGKFGRAQPQRERDEPPTPPRSAATAHAVVAWVRATARRGARVDGAGKATQDRAPGPRARGAAA